MLGQFISTIAFFVVAWYLNRYLDDLGISKGMTRGTLVLEFTFLVSWGIGLMVDWVEVKIEGAKPASQTAGNLSQPLKALSQHHP